VNPRQSTPAHYVDDGDDHYGQADEECGGRPEPAKQPGIHAAIVRDTGRCGVCGGWMGSGEKADDGNVSSIVSIVARSLDLQCERPDYGSHNPTQLGVRAWPRHSGRTLPHSFWAAFATRTDAK
jgi:hypothetical protein